MPRKIMRPRRNGENHPDVHIQPPAGLPCRPRPRIIPRSPVAG